MRSMSMSAPRSLTGTRSVVSAGTSRLASGT
jgi:hypothetical protein